MIEGELTVTVAEEVRMTLLLLSFGGAAVPKQSRRGLRAHLSPANIQAKGRAMWTVDNLFVVSLLMLLVGMVSGIIAKARCQRASA